MCIIKVITFQLPLIFRHHSNQPVDLSVLRDRQASRNNNPKLVYALWVEIILTIRSATNYHTFQQI